MVKQNSTSAAVTMTKQHSTMPQGSYIEMGRQAFFANYEMTRKKIQEVLANKRIQVAAASGAGGATVCGVGGAAVASFFGVVIGGAVGVIPALFTFGLSIPFGAAIGGGCGLIAGSTIAGGVGLTGGVSLGYWAYANDKACRLFEQFRAKALLYKNAAGQHVSGLRSYLSSAQVRVSTFCYDTLERTRVFARSAKDASMETIADPDFQVTAKSAAGGAVALGSGGAAVGAIGGGALGAAVGVLPAIFTFGLSIPVFAVIGGGSGIVAGTAVGGTTGLVGGGVAGYGYVKRSQIATFATGVFSKVQSSVSSVLEPALHTAGFKRA